MANYSPAGLLEAESSTKRFDYNWHLTELGQQYLSCLSSYSYDSDKKNDVLKRRQFGIIEYPSISPSVHTVAYKVFVTGKSGVGKSYFIKLLSGAEPPVKYAETTGIMITNVFWPFCINGSVVLYKIEFWDAGHNSLSRFDHILPACMNKVDMIISMFSYVDKKSFNDMPQSISVLSKLNTIASYLVVGSKFDLEIEHQVTNLDVQTFQAKMKIPCLTSRFDLPFSDKPKVLNKTAYLLNRVCQILWERDENLLHERLKKMSLSA